MTITINANEEEYVELLEKSFHEMLTDEEYSQFLKLKKKLRIKNCPYCKGQGYQSHPSMLGYGWDEGQCNRCEGTGTYGQSAELHQKLIAVYTY